MRERERERGVLKFIITSPNKKSHFNKPLHIVNPKLNKI